MKLEGKVALITGASRGIGRAAAIRFAREGAKLVLASRTQSELETLAKEVFDLYDTDALVVPCDVTKSAEVKALVERAVATFGRIDILLNSAGVGYLKPITELTVEEFDEMVDVNLKGTFYASKFVSEVMVKQKSGHIINLPGILGKAVMRMSSGYSASKYGVTGLAKAMTQDLMRDGVKISLLHFGGVNTSFWDKITMRVQREKMLTVDQAADMVLLCATQPDQLVLGELVLQPESHQL
ncbi:MAG: SDR family oxidoreductase [Chloroherpetonaceae bacterium]|nr:SDR family oxidoreductase [Chloroherpetonaceae bacterium]MCS7210847.1 SDR family oxidoreductase [Chloroherpetonaceae bacterium]MDW8018466.1 SDR family oxidoreductase [Chloroherpetonaceae bacterium]